MTISREQMDRIKKHLAGDKSEALGAWILDKNALNLALARVAEVEGDRDLYKHVIDSIAEFLKSGKVDPLSQAKSTTFHRVRDLAAQLSAVENERDSLRDQLKVAEAKISALGGQAKLDYLRDS